MNSRELKFINAFNSIPGVGAAALKILKKKFGSFERAWLASDGDLREAGLESRALQAVLWKKSSLNPDREMEKIIRENIWMLTAEEPEFPEHLKEISQPPFVIYGRGKIDLLKDISSGGKVSLGVVGTRKPTAYGLESCEFLVRDLVSAGLVITSGLATGIDTKAHETAILNKGKTIAILGSGLNTSSIFPPENQGLAKKIADSEGLVISEYSPGTPAVREHFPQRNRLISGLSRGTLVVEAREKSGALITAGCALEQNREVFAVPGSVFSLSSVGPNKLIQQGAKLVFSAKDILEELGLEYTGGARKREAEMLDEKEYLLLNLLEEPLGIDLLKERSGLETSVVVSCLSLLELKGLIRNLGQDTYQKIN